MASPASESLYAGRRNPILTVLVWVVIGTLVMASLYYVLGRAEGHPWSFFDCVYMTVITVTTVGYGETLPDLDTVPYARAYTIAVMLIGYGIVVWAFSTVIATVVEGRFRELLGRRRMMKAIAELSGHYIVCGLGETGRHVVIEMLATKRKVVVIERERERLRGAAEQEGLLFIEGDCEEEQTLLDAGIRRAAGMVACLPEDKDNIFVVLSARQLNPELRIIARGVQTESVAKIVRAGADVVVAPNFIGGLRIASEMIRPHVTTFLDVMLRDKEHVIRVEEVTIPPGSHLCDMRIRDAEIQQRTGLLILATQAEGQDGFTYNPGPDHLLEAGMTLIVLGDVDDAHRLREMVSR